MKTKRDYFNMMGCENSFAELNLEVNKKHLTMPGFLKIIRIKSKPKYFPKWFFKLLRKLFIEFIYKGLPMHYNCRCITLEEIKDEEKK